jgi:uncharacterized protein YndB with AHSA1/START domain
MSMPQGEVLRLTRIFQAPRALVFRAWTETEQLKQWLCPHEHWGLEVEADPRVGGSFRFVMKDTENGRDHIVRGTYREIRSPERLIFTWQWETDHPGFPETVVTVDFRDLGGQTEVTLTHEALPSPESRESHAKGWNGCLDRLAKLL